MSLISVKNNKERFEIKIFKIRFSHKKKHKDINLINRKITIIIKIKTFLYKYFIQPFVLKRNEKKPVRYLEIGPGETRIKDFEGINIVKTSSADYIADLSKKIPLASDSFDIIYTSHFLEHIAWYNVEPVINEIYRILKPNGILELWIPDGLKIAQQLILAENGTLKTTPDGWKRRNPDDNPYLWVNGRLFYGDNPTYPSWHKGLFTPNYLMQILQKAGFKNIEKMDNSQCRGYDHGWINLGIKAQK